MRRFLGAFLAVALALGAGVAAHAQYARYGTYGWGGWGGTGSTVQGSIATGMGNFAAAAGQYNVDTAQARSINAQTAMQFNEYMYAVNKQNSATNLLRRQQQQKKVNETADTTAKRLRETPEPRDIHSGDALNVVLNDLINPKVYTQVVQQATTPVDSRLVKNINFQHAANMILISLGDVSARGVPEALKTPDFDSDRKSIRGIVTKGREEASSANQVSPETRARFRAAVQAAKDKADSIYAQGTRQRNEADNFLKALLGLSRMLEQPDVAAFLKGLNQYPTTTLGHLISFMQNFNLRFGVAKTAEQEAAYDQLYPMLVKLRDQAQALDSGPMSAEAPLPDPKQAMSLFSGMPYEHLGPTPPAPAPAPPGARKAPLRPGTPK